jgi:hypothetical protein
MWLNSGFSIGEGTTPALGSGDGGRVFGSSGLVPGGGVFVTHGVSRDLKFGFASRSGGLRFASSPWPSRSIPGRWRQAKRKNAHWRA